MRILASRRPHPDIDDSTRELAAALHAGRERADAGVAFLVNRMSDRFRCGGDYAVELFLDWMDILMEGNKDTASKFYASVIPILPPETRRRILGSASPTSALAEEEFDPVVQSLISKIAIGGNGGAEALSTIFDALAKVKGTSEAHATIDNILGQISPELRATMMPYMPDRLKETLPALRKKPALLKNKT